MNNFSKEVKAVLLPKDDNDENKLSVIYDPLFKKEPASAGLRKSKTLITPVNKDRLTSKFDTIEGVAYEFNKVQESKISTVKSLDNSDAEITQLTFGE